MATRQEIQQRRQAMRAALMEECRSAGAFSGVMLPPLHELSRLHGLSVPLVSETIQELVKEGVLHTRRGAGTFVGRIQAPDGSHTAPFLLLMSDDGSGATHRAALRRGFEERISQLGGSSLSLSVEILRHLREQGGVLPVAGIFDFHENEEDLLSTDGCDVPRVEFAYMMSPRDGSDVVDFDNTGGGRQATEHLLRLGHKSIAFIGVHDADATQERFGWSAQRADGWEGMLTDAGHYQAGLFFSGAVSPEDQKTGARGAAADFVTLLSARAGFSDRSITAVVVTNHFVAHQLLQVLVDFGIPERDWPSIMAFDEQASPGGQVISTFVLPWDEVGREAADLLWLRNRQRSDKSGAEATAAGPVTRLVPMRLISRLTCQPVWSSAPAAVALALPGRSKETRSSKTRSGHSAGGALVRPESPVAAVSNH